MRGESLAPPPGRCKVGLALGAGGARGAAHVGVLKVLESEGIQVDCIAGTSIGALVGALYACGMHIAAMETLATRIKRRHWVDAVWPGMGLVAGDKLVELLRLLTGNRTFADLRIPLAIVAVDIETGEEVVIKEGCVAEAVRASTAVPGIFAPYRLGGRLLVDGGVLNLVPGDVAREMGADIVVAVCLGQDRQARVKVKTIADVIMQAVDIMEREILRSKLVGVDVLISPDVGGFSSVAFGHVGQCVAAGETAARQAMPRLRELLAAREGRLC